MLINGTVKDSIGLDSRALSYGDGVFETILLHEGKTVYLQAHLDRLNDGCRRLGINYDLQQLHQEIQQLSPQFTDFGVLKIIISRNAGGRGYRSDPDAGSTRILTLHTLPDYSLFQSGIHAFVCQQRLAIQPALAGIKHLNRLEQVLASQEWPGDEFQEGFMLDMNGNLIEGTKSNVFFVESGVLITPELYSCGVDGVMRKALIKYFDAEIKTETCTMERILHADEVFVCNSVFGVWPVLSLKHDTHVQYYTPGKFCLKAKQVFSQALT